jgi:hypothetical protein
MASLYGSSSSSAPISGLAPASLPAGASGTKEKDGKEKEGKEGEVGSLSLDEITGSLSLVSKAPSFLSCFIRIA